MNNNRNSYEYKLRKYYWNCFISEFSKTCLFFIIFMFLDLIPEYIVALLTLISLRSNGGGLHFNKYICCLSVSFIFLFSSILLSIYVIPSEFVIIISLLACTVVGYILVPITSPNRPPATSEQIRKSKHNTTIIILTYFILICICPNTIYLLICYWTVMLHILQLIIAHIKEVKKNV